MLLASSALLLIDAVDSPPPPIQAGARAANSIGGGKS